MLPAFIIYFFSIEKRVGRNYWKSGLFLLYGSPVCIAAANPNANAQVCILIQLQTTTDQKEPKRDPTLFQKWQI